MVPYTCVIFKVFSRICLTPPSERTRYIPCRRDRGMEGEEGGGRFLFRLSSSCQKYHDRYEYNLYTDPSRATLELFWHFRVFPKLYSNLQKRGLLCYFRLFLLYTAARKVSSPASPARLPPCPLLSLSPLPPPFILRLWWTCLLWMF